MKSWSRWWPAALALLIPLVLYGPLLRDHSYVWDDWLLFVNDPALRTPGGLWARAFEPVLWGSSYLRPLVMASFGAELQTFGNHPHWPHFFNLALHALNTLLVLSLARGLLRDPAAPAWRTLLPAVLYAVHPALVEATAWISGRFDLLVTSFMLAGLAVLLHWQGWRRDLGFALCFGLALLCKEMAITLPVLAALLLIWRGDVPAPLPQALRALFGRPFWRLLFLLSAVAAAYFALRWSVLGSVAGNLRGVNSNVDFWHRLALTGWALLFYLRGTWLPFFNAAPVYPVHAASFSQVELLTGGAVAMLSLLTLLVLLLRHPRHALSLGFAAWVLALLPVLHLLPLPFTNIGHDRFLTLPLALWALMFIRLRAAPAADGVRWLRVAALPLLCWVLASVASVRNSVPIWANDLSLWTWAHEKNPTSREVNNNLLVAANRFDSAELARALIDANVAAGLPEFEINKAVFEIRQREPKAALRVLEALEKQMGSPHADLNQPDSYIDSFRAPQQTYEALPTLYSTKAEAYFMLEDYGLSLRMSRVALLYQPNAPVALIYRALSLYGLGRWDEAERAYVVALAAEPKSGVSRLQSSRDKLLRALCERAADPSHRACQPA